MSGTVTIEQRKTDHIQINLEQEVRGLGTDPGFRRYRFIHNALPELNFSEVDPGTIFFGKRLRAPLLISSMTGGVERGSRLFASGYDAKHGVPHAVAELISREIALELNRPRTHC